MTNNIIRPSIPATASVCGAQAGDAGRGKVGKERQEKVSGKEGETRRSKSEDKVRAKERRGGGGRDGKRQVQREE